MLGTLMRRFSLHKRGSPDIWAISYPKSGRTWHRVLVGAYLCFKHGIDLNKAPETKALTARLGLPSLRYTHNGANFLDPWDADDIRVADQRLWKGAGVIFLVRDVKDTLVSSYFHARFREETYDGPISAFVRNRQTGAEKVLTALNRWHENRFLACGHLVQTYEAMHRNPVACLTDALAFCGFGPVNSSLVKQAVAFATADNMRKLEMSGFFKSQSLSNHTNPDAAKVRTARIGDHKNHLSEADIAYIDALEATIGNPFTATGSPSKAISRLPGENACPQIG